MIASLARRVAAPNAIAGTWWVAAVLLALSPARPAVAANCVYTEATLLTPVVARDGALLVSRYCADDIPCADGLEVEVLVDGAPVDGRLELLLDERHNVLALFRPDAPLPLGTHEAVVRGSTWGDGPESLEVVEELPVALDLDAVEVTLEAGMRPAGERICCPTYGEGDCDPSCGGLDGEQRVAVVRATFAALGPSVVWRLWLDDEPEPDAVFGGAEPGAVGVLEAYSSQPRASHCWRLEAWNVQDGAMATVEECASLDVTDIGEVVPDWAGMELDKCRAPPIVGGWGYDTAGAPDPRNYPVAPEPLRQAWCAAREDCRGDVEWPCEHFAHYCPEAAASAVDAGGIAADADGDAGVDENLASGARGDAGPDASALGGPSGAPRASEVEGRRRREGCGVAAMGGAPPRGALGAWLAVVVLGLTRLRRASRRPHTKH